MRNQTREKAKPIIINDKEKRKGGKMQQKRIHLGEEKRKKERMKES